MPAAAGQLRIHVLQAEINGWFSLADAATTRPSEFGVSGA